MQGSDGTTNGSSSSNNNGNNGNNNSQQSPPSSVSVSRYSDYVQNFCDLGKSSNTSLFRIGKRPETGTTSNTTTSSNTTTTPSSIFSFTSSSSLSSKKECWINPLELGIFNYSSPLSSSSSSSSSVSDGGDGGGGRGYYSSKILEKNKNFSNLVSKYASNMMAELSSTSTSSGVDSSSSSSNTTTTTTTPNRLLFLPDLSSLPMASSTPLAAWSVKIEQMISEYLLAITVGCVLGAAVATGASIGLFAASGMIRVSNQYITPFVQHWWWKIMTTTTRNDTSTPNTSTSRSNMVVPPSTSTSGGTNTDKTGRSVTTSTRTTINREEEEEEGGTNVSVILSSSTPGNNNHAFFNTIYGGSPSTTTTTTTTTTTRILLLKAIGTTTNCETCLNDLSILLSKNGATWNQVKQLSVYLVSSPPSPLPQPTLTSIPVPPVDSDDVSNLANNTTIEPYQFREALKGYPVDTKSSCIVSIRFVQRLENQHALIEVEALAAVQ